MDFYTAGVQCDSNKIPQGQKSWMRSQGAESLQTGHAGELQIPGHCRAKLHHSCHKSRSQRWLRVLWVTDFVVTPPKSHHHPQKGTRSCFCSGPHVHGWRKPSTWLREGWKGPTILFPPFGCQCQVLFPMSFWMICHQSNWVLILGNGVIGCHLTIHSATAQPHSWFTAFQKVFFKNAPKYLLRIDCLKNLKYNIINMFLFVCLFLNKILYSSCCGWP